jgi:23S rRNA (guanine745-N1)-methyltransferase
VTGTPELPPAAVALLACPVCGGALAVAGGSLRCTSGHSFDRARHGHVTLLAPGSSPPRGDDAAMVADRVAFLGAGHYAGLTAALARAVEDGGPVRSLLDLGGGTGAHLAGVLDRLPEAVGVVLDASRYAARRAARAHPRAMAVVADGWGRLPVRDGALDRVLVVFAPRGGAEIARVLRPDGRLVVATPEPDHLAELVGPLSLLTVDPDKQHRLAATLGPHLVPVTARTHRERLVLDRAAVTALVGMGPHARHRSREQVSAALARLPEPLPVTVAVRVATWRRTPRSGSGGVPTARSDDAGEQRLRYES